MAKYEEPLKRAKHELNCSESWAVRLFCFGFVVLFVFVHELKQLCMSTYL